MAKVTNTVILHNEYVELITETDNYIHTVLIDTEDLTKVGKVRISNTGYAYTCQKSLSVSHVVMNHTSNMKTVVDHINGNTLDNRKCNLRVVYQHENQHNKTRFVRNNTGVIGIAYRKNKGYEYYRVSLTDRSKGVDNNMQGKRITKQFSINKLGKAEAFKQANEYLEMMKIRLGYLV
jgi:hypothetical protein